MVLTERNTLFLHKAVVAVHLQPTLDQYTSVFSPKTLLCPVWSSHRGCGDLQPAKTN